MWIGKCSNVTGGLKLCSWFIPEFQILVIFYGKAIFNRCAFSLPMTRMTKKKKNRKRRLKVLLFFSFLIIFDVGDVDLTDLSLTNDARGTGFLPFLLLPHVYLSPTSIIPSYLFKIRCFVWGYHEIDLFYERKKNVLWFFFSWCKLNMTKTWLNLKDGIRGTVNMRKIPFFCVCLKFMLTLATFTKGKKKKFIPLRFLCTC